jgi:hypothetical protein
MKRKTQFGVRLFIFLFLFAFIFPGYAFAQFGSPAFCTADEVVVALQEGGAASDARLRAYSLRNRSMQERAIAYLPVRIESIDIGDVYGDGDNSVVAGLFQTYTGSTGAVRVYTYADDLETWTEQSLGQDILNNVETLDIGDANNDGKNDIVIGLEFNRSTNAPRIQLFSFLNGAWTSEAVSVPSWQKHIQHVKVADLDRDGQNEIVALISNVHVAPIQFPLVEVDVFRKIDGEWVRDEIYRSNDQDYMSSDRLVAANLDADSELEVLFGGWGGVNALYKLERVAGDEGEVGEWESDILMNVPGIIDGLETGDITDDGEIDIFFSSQNRLYVLEQDEDNEGGWDSQLLGTFTDAFRIWDTDVGDVNDTPSTIEGIAAADSELLLTTLLDDGTFDTSVLTDTGIAIDSAQIGDADNITVDLSPEIFEFLRLWFNRDPSADYNGDGFITVPDIFAFLAGWFERC